MAKQDWHEPLKGILPGGWKNPTGCGKQPVGVWIESV